MGRVIIPSRFKQLSTQVAYTGATNAVTFNIPSGVVAGNMLIAQLHYAGDSAQPLFNNAHGVLSGFTSIAWRNINQEYTATMYKVATSGDAAGGTWTTSYINTNALVVAVIHEITNPAGTPTAGFNGPTYSNNAAIPVGSGLPAGTAVVAAVQSYGSAPTLNAAGWNVDAAGGLTQSPSTKTIWYGSATATATSGSAPAGTWSNGYGWVCEAAYVP